MAGLVRLWLSCWPWMASSPEQMSRTTVAVAGMPLMRQLPFALGVDLTVKQQVVQAS